MDLKEIITELNKFKPECSDIGGLETLRQNSEELARKCENKIKSLKCDFISKLLKDNQGFMEELKSIDLNKPDGFEFDCEGVRVYYKHDFTGLLKLSSMEIIRDSINLIIDELGHSHWVMDDLKTVTDFYDCDIGLIDFDKKLFTSHAYNDPFYISGLTRKNYVSKLSEHDYSRLFEIKNEKIVSFL